MKEDALGMRRQGNKACTTEASAVSVAWATAKPAGNSNALAPEAPISNSNALAPEAPKSASNLGLLSARRFFRILNERATLTDGVTWASGSPVSCAGKRKGNDTSTKSVDGDAGRATLGTTRASAASRCCERYMKHARSSTP